MTYSVRNILIAVLAAVAAAVCVLVYTAGYKNQVTQQQHRMKVLVASGTITPGTSGDEAVRHARLQDVLVSDVAPGAVRDVGQIKGLVATQAVFAGQQLVADAFQPALSQSPKLRLARTDRGIRINVDPTSGVIGDLKAGDRVDVFATLKVKDGATGDDLAYTRRLLTDRVVLEAPQPASGGTTKDGQQPVMLQVSQAEAAKLAFLEATPDTNVVWLVVRPPQSKAQDAPVTIENVDTLLYDGVDRAEIRSKILAYRNSLLAAKRKADATTSTGTAATTPAPATAPTTPATTAPAAAPTPTTATGTDAAKGAAKKTGAAR